MGVEVCPSAPVLKSWSEVDEAAREMSQFQARMDSLCAERDARLNSIQMDYKARLAPLQEAFERRARDIEEFCRARRCEFEDQRSKRLAWITVSFRRSRRLDTLARMTWAKVLALLKEHGRSDLVRVREEVDREAVRAAGLSASDLRALGMRIIVEDHFGYELNRTRDAARGEKA